MAALIVHLIIMLYDYTHEQILYFDALYQQSSVSWVLLTSYKLEVD